MKVALVAAPLTARTGVYNSAIEMTAEARSCGYDWSALLGVSASASGAPTNEEGVDEVVCEPNGPLGVARIRGLLARSEVLRRSDIVISLVPQTDMAMALQRRPWVAYLRGAPWPDRNESTHARRILWKFLETQAVKRASAVWATTEILAMYASDVGRIAIVPPGISPIPRVWDGRHQGGRLPVWAARYDVDKNPGLFLKIMDDLDIQGEMFGAGPFEEQLKSTAGPNVKVAGWAPSGDIWARASVYVGTAHREAFGRSAVEAAMAGVPVVVSDQYGCAQMLYTDNRLRDRFVISASDDSGWRRAIVDLYENEDLRATASDHVHANAAKLTMKSSVAGIREHLGHIGNSARA